MHIAFITTELATGNSSSGGLASFISNMAKIFTENEHKVTVVLVTTKEQKIDPDGDYDLVNIFISKKTWSRLDFLAKILTFNNLNKRDEARKVFVNMLKSYKANQYIKKLNGIDKIDVAHYTNLASLALFADKKIPYLIRVSGLLNLWRGAEQKVAKLEYKDNRLLLNEKLELVAMKRAKHLIAPSQLIAQVLKENKGFEVKVVESPFYLKAEKWNNRIYDTEVKGKDYFLFYGTLKYTKGIQLIADTVYELLDCYREMYLVLAGKSFDVDNDNNEKVRAHNLIYHAAKEYRNRVLYLGQLVREELYPVIENAHICLFPSRIENLSNACIEALALGKVVIATKGASYEQLISDKENGFLCLRDDRESFLQCVKAAMIMSDKDKIEMEKRAKLSVERLQPKLIYKKYMDCYNCVIEDMRWHIR